jgi:hypothetical protein
MARFIRMVTTCWKSSLGTDQLLKSTSSITGQFLNIFFCLFNDLIKMIWSTKSDKIFYNALSREMLYKGGLISPKVFCQKFGDIPL